MTPTKSAKPVIDAIGKGSYDPHLAKIADAIGDRMRSSGAVLRWKVSVDDMVITEEDITLNEAVHLEELLGKTWASISPTASARDCRAIIAVGLQRSGLTPEEALARLKDFTIDDALAALSVY